MLIVLISIYGGIVSSAQNVAKKKKEKAQKAEKPLEPVVTLPVSSTQSNQTNGVSDEVIAVISAAVYSMYGSSEKVRIKSIKKSNGGRSAWANAGVLNNTRPF